MATLRPSSSSPAPPQQYHVTFTSRLIFFLTLLSFSLASLAFLLQWRGGLHDDHLIFSVNNQINLPGIMTTSSDHNPVASSGSDCADILGQSHRFVFPYFRNWKLNYDGADLNPRISIITSTSAGLEQTLPWIFYHKVVGVSNFYVFVEGKAATPNGVKVLKSIPGVKVIPRTKELDEEQAKSRIWNETWLASFFYRPCNYELFVKQSLNMEMGIAMARDSGMDWIIHLDTDELAYPIGTSDFSLTQLFARIPERFDTVVFPNFEGAVERDDIKEPFSEVSLFKKNFDRLAREIYFGSYKEAARGNPNYFLTYGNGKSAARIRDHLRPNGAHRWSNYRKRAVETKLEEAVVLHYTYPKFSDLTSRRDRCKCKPTKEEVQRCFILQFDRVAFIIASTSTDEEMLLWYREHVVWSDIKLKLKLLNKGILTRIYEPMIIIQTLKESGVFSSAIASSQSAEESGDHESVSSVESSNNNSTRIGQELVNVQANARKILEISTGFGIYNEEMAAPPLSPPTPADFVASIKILVGRDYRVVEMVDDI